MMSSKTQGLSTEAARSSVAGLLQRFDKRMPGSHQSGHQGLLTGVYRQAIELNGGSLVSAGGYVTTFGLVCGLLTVYFVGAGIRDTFIGGAYFFFVFDIFAAFALFLIGIYFEMFGPSESPIYFDRAQRKVYYVHQGKRKRFILFGPARIEPRAVDWSLVDCEHHASLGGSAASARRVHYLLFLVRKSESDPSIVDSFALPQCEFPGALWEYIRQYMEAGMPPLAAGEAAPVKGQAFEMMAALRQRRRNYWRDWRDFPGTQLWQHLALPLFLVFFVVNRFVVWTAQKVTWPAEITQALGPVVTEDDLANDTGHQLRAAPQA